MVSGSRDIHHLRGPAGSRGVEGSGSRGREGSRGPRGPPNGGPKGSTLSPYGPFWGPYLADIEQILSTLNPLIPSSRRQNVSWQVVRSSGFMGSFWGYGVWIWWSWVWDLEGSGVRSRGRVGSETPPLYYTPRARGSVLDKSEAQKGRSIRRLIGCFGPPKEDMVHGTRHPTN